MKSSTFTLQRSLIFSVITLTFMALLLTACDFDLSFGSVETDITVFRNSYRMKMIISFTKEEMELIGGPDVFQAFLIDQLPDANQDGSYVTWRDITSEDSGVYRYEITTKRTDYNHAHSAGFSWQEIQYSNRKAYKFDYSELSSVLGGFSNYTITLHAGRILDTNGIKLDNQTVIWVDPDAPPYAIVVPKNATLGFFIILAAGVIIFCGFFVFLTLMVLGITISKKNDDKLTDLEKAAET